MHLPLVALQYFTPPSHFRKGQAPGFTCTSVLFSGSLMFCCSTGERWQWVCPGDTLPTCCWERGMLAWGEMEGGRRWGWTVPRLQEPAETAASKQGVVSHSLTKTWTMIQSAAGTRSPVNPAPGLALFNTINKSHDFQTAPVSVTSTFLLSGLMLSVPFNLSLVPPLCRDILKAPTHHRQKAKLLLGFLICDRSFSFPPQLLFVARCWHFLSASSGFLDKLGALRKIKCSAPVVWVCTYLSIQISLMYVCCMTEGSWGTSAQDNQHLSPVQYMH